MTHAFLSGIRWPAGVRKRSCAFVVESSYSYSFQEAHHGNFEGDSPVRPYDTPAVVYEAALVAHAVTTSPAGVGCPLSGGDLLNWLDLTQGK